MRESLRIRPFFDLEPFQSVDAEVPTRGTSMSTSYSVPELTRGGRYLGELSPPRFVLALNL